MEVFSLALYHYGVRQYLPYGYTAFLVSCLVAFPIYAVPISWAGIY